MHGNFHALFRSVHLSTVYGWKGNQYDIRASRGDTCVHGPGLNPRLGLSNWTSSLSDGTASEPYWSRLGGLSMYC